MSEVTDGSGWLPVEARDALEAEQDKARAELVERLLALDARARVLALLEHAVPCAGEVPPQPLRPADLARLLESFPGAEPADAKALEARFPTLPPA